MSKQPASPPPGDRPTKPAPPPPPSWRYWLWPLALLATIVLYIFLPAIHAPSPVNLNFSQFESRAAAHQIKTANIQNSANGSNTVATGDLTNGKTYTTVIPGQPTTALNNQLKADGLNPNYSPPSSGLGSVLLSLLVLILPLLLIFWVFRRMAKAAGGGAGGLQGVLGVGRSRAKVFDAERPSTKFSDVAGYAGVKEEIGEVVDFLRNTQRYQRAGAVAPRGALMIGPPGTGKTLLARAVAGEASVPFFSVAGLQLRRAVRRRRRRAGARPVRRGAQAGARDHLHRRDRRHRPAPGRLGRGGVQRRARADAEPAAVRDGRV